MQTDKKHWYDGSFYDKLIAPNQDKMFSLIRSLIEKDSNVLDVGCGTGRFAFQIAPVCNSVTGYDLSSKNIKTANQNLNHQTTKNISFIHGNAINLKEKLNDRFDFAVITYVIHEIPEAERAEVLKAIKKVSDKIIIGDYTVPRTSGIWDIVNELVEFAAGVEHYKNFKSFVKNGGLKGLARENNFQILKEISNNPLSSQILILK